MAPVFLTRVLSRLTWRAVTVGYTAIAMVGFTLLIFTTLNQEVYQLQARSWGGFDERPLAEKCYAQERTAMLLAIFVGTFGVDQFYAHHWPLAVFKLLTGGGFGLWALVDIVLWVVGGVYGTPGCPGGSHTGWQY